MMFCKALCTYGLRIDVFLKFYVTTHRTDCKIPHNIYELPAVSCEPLAHALGVLI
jgi:hypothetical protein